MGKQLNFYRSAELQAELEAEAIAQSNRFGCECTVQQVLRCAWNERPAKLRLARDAKAGAKKGGR